MSSRLVLVAWLLPAIGCSPASDYPYPVTMGSLLEEMTDLEGLSTFPLPSFSSHLSSSYDRASKDPRDESTWYANGDFGNFVRIEKRQGRSEYVMLDASGPGAVLRIWSATPNGVLRIYLDYAKDPVIAEPMDRLLGGKVPWIPEPLSGVRDRGYNLYLPIPFARHCKITSDQGGFHYHVGYRLYGEDTVVQSFQAKQLQDLAAQIQQVRERLSAPGEGCPCTPTFQHEATLLRLVETSWSDGDGPAAVSCLRLLVRATDRTLALRQLLLTMTFDGQETVAVPLGDFFAGGLGGPPLEALPLSISSAGELRSRWLMPYQRSARVTIRNLGNQAAGVTLLISRRKHNWNPRSMHFHAGWRRSANIPSYPSRDWTYLKARGQGLYVGTAMTIANPVEEWWGEGDEKIYVDGESFPSHFGTGTEDYFGYAWRSTAIFSHAYHGQPRSDGPVNKGITTNFRFHVLDPIPFRKSLLFDMEIAHWHHNAILPELSVVTYWYGTPGSTSSHTRPTFQDLVVPSV